MYVVLVILFYFGVAECFLYHEENVKAFVESDSKYFGYSVLLQKGSPSKLVVSSPMEPVTGSIFVIDVDSGNRVKFQPTYTENELPKDYLFGAAMDGGTTVGESVIVCKPKYVIHRIISNESNYFANGGCYIFPNINDTGTHQAIYPNSASDKQIWNLKYFYAFGQAGISVRYLDNYKEFIVGSPGLLSWAGGAVKIVEREVVLPPQSRSVKSGQVSRRMKGKLRRSEKEYFEFTYERLNQLNDNYLEDYDYAGYSVAYGELIRGSKFFIIGSPRSHDLRGAVFYINTKENRVTGTLLGSENIGSYFGSSICVMDINGDGLDDLLVGAPMQKDRLYDEGYVYQYINGLRADLTLLSTITPSKLGGRFGTAMTNLGKATLDSFDSVAISSPYENNGKGAVYIYIGSTEGLKFSQRIEAAPGAMGFGFSLSRAVDVDNNNENDLGVGAYKSRGSYILFARPVFYYEISIESNARLYSYQENKPLNISYCIKVVRATTVLTNITVYFDTRLQNRQISTKENINNEFCKEIIATLHDNISDMENPINIEVTVHEEDCPKCPVSSPTYVKTNKHRIPFLFNCGNDQICTPNLVVSSDIDSIYTVGSEEDISLTVNIENKGEYAYICKLQVELPMDVSIKSASKDCNNNNCILVNPLENTDTKIFNLDFSKFHYIANAVTFRVIIDCLNYTTSSISTVNLRYKSIIHADAKISEIIYKNKNTTADVKGKFEYFIKNQGPSPLENFPFKIKIPRSLGHENILDVYQPEISNVDVVCTPNSNYTIKDEDNTLNRDSFSVKAAQSYTFKSIDINCKDSKIRCLEIVCMARKFLKNANIKITFPVRPNIGLIVKEYQTTFHLISELTYELESHTHLYESKITLRDNEEGTYIAYWAIILGIIIGILILAALIVGLVKLGFFNRSTYKKMQEQKLQDKSEEMFELSGDAGKSTDET